MKWKEITYGELTENTEVRFPDTDDGRKYIKGVVFDVIRNKEETSFLIRWDGRRTSDPRIGQSCQPNNTMIWARIEENNDEDNGTV